MVNNKYIFIIPFLLLILVVAGLLTKKVFTAPKVHYHAGFLVIANNRKVDFSGYQYMAIAPCTKDNKASGKEDPQFEKAHLHDNVGDVVHVEHANADWKDLFQNLKYPIDYQYALAYINGVKVTDFQDKRINPYDSLVVFTGKTSNTDTFLAQAVTKDHILKVEKNSETCGH